MNPNIFVETRAQNYILNLVRYEGPKCDELAQHSSGSFRSRVVQLGVRKIGTLSVTHRSPKKLKIKIRTSLADEDIG